MKGIALATILVAGAISDDDLDETPASALRQSRHGGERSVAWNDFSPPSSVYAASGSCQNPHCYSVLIANGSFRGPSRSSTTRASRCQIPRSKLAAT